VPFANPHMKLVFAKFRHKGQKLICRAVHRLASYDPAHVCPQTAIARRVRIAFLVGILVMDAVCRNPGDGAALKSKRAAEGQEVLDPFWTLVAVKSRW